MTCSLSPLIVIVQDLATHPSYSLKIVLLTFFKTISALKPNRNIYLLRKPAGELDLLSEIQLWLADEADDHR
jgi:hypothetical protein